MGWDKRVVVVRWVLFEACILLLCTLHFIAFYVITITIGFPYNRTSPQLWLCNHIVLPQTSLPNTRCRRKKKREREKNTHTKKRREIEENYFTHKVKTICHHFCYKPAHSEHTYTLSLSVHPPNFLSFYTCFLSLFLNCYASAMPYSK